VEAAGPRVGHCNECVRSRFEVSKRAGYVIGCGGGGVLWVFGRVQECVAVFFMSNCTQSGNDRLDSMV